MRFFDGHNDVPLKLWRADDRRGASFVDGSCGGHVSLPLARKGGLRGGFFALYAPQPPSPDDPLGDQEGAVIDHPPLNPIAADEARRIALAQADILTCLARRHPDAFRLCRSAADIDAADADGALAAILHMEGAEAIGADLTGLETFFAAGLRSLGPVWSRPNHFATGIPFRFPGDPEEGPGLTEAGAALIRACDEMGVLIDLSHLNAAGVRDVARLSTRPLMATHSNCHALCPSSRNLTDAQLEMIADTGGIVGVNFAVGFLRADGRMIAQTGLEVMLSHLDHMIGKLGETGVALGSDFDGAMIPARIGDAGGLPALAEAMAQAGWGETLIARICHDNWVAFLRRVLG